MSLDMLGFDDELARLVGLGCGEAGLPGRAAIVAPLVAKREQIAKAFDVALAPTGDAVTQPVFFHHDLAVELVLVAFFFRKHVVAPLLEGREALVDLANLTAIEPCSRTRQIRKKTPVMADDNERATTAGEFGFQPFDGGEIEMVGRLIEQQDVGRGCEHRCDRRAARFAAGEVRGVFLSCEAKLL